MFRDARGERTARGARDARGVCGAVFRDTEVSEERTDHTRVWEGGSGTELLSLWPVDTIV